MKAKLLALLATVMAFTSCTQAQQVQDQVKNAPTDFWASVHTVLTFLLDTVLGVATNWLRGLLGL